jgi:GTP-binding protein HflX
VLQEDQLFATLDPTTRRLQLPTNQNVLLSDTVGFIRKLPHQLVEAFKATLDEVVQADLLLHVVDVTAPRAEEQAAAVQTVLEEMSVAGKPTLMVLNKMDLLPPGRGVEGWLARHPGAVPVSARTRAGFDDLLAELGTRLRPVRDYVELVIPHDQAALIARLHEVGQVVEQKFDGHAGRFKVRLPPHCRAEFAHCIRRDL